MIHKSNRKHPGELCGSPFSLSHLSPSRLYILQLSDKEMEVIQVSKRKLLKALELILSVILSTAKTLDKMGKPPKPDGETKGKV